MAYSEINSKTKAITEKLYKFRASVEIFQCRPFEINSKSDLFKFKPCLNLTETRYSWWRKVKGNRPTRVDTPSVFANTGLRLLQQIELIESRLILDEISAIMTLARNISYESGGLRKREDALRKRDGAAVVAGERRGGTGCYWPSWRPVQGGGREVTGYYKRPLI